MIVNCLVRITKKCNDKWPLSTRERIKGREEQFDTHTKRDNI